MNLKECVIMEQMEQVKELLDKRVYKRVTVGVVLAGVAAYLIYKRYK